MIDALKRTLYAGIGATVITAEKIEAALEELVEKGKLSADEARQTASKISEESKKEFEEAQASLKSMFDELLDHAPVVQKKDLEPILERLEALEKAVEELKEKDS
ncbi:MAG: phasin family protein [Puniceicoccaceae bacterium]